jgi:hypothetical protein
VKWAYGITTVPRRRRTTLPKTVETLAAAGFHEPRYFVDDWDGTEYPNATYRRPKIRTFGNWILGMAELYIREPDADRYAMFQDDIVACVRLREYLERSTVQPNAYWNCITYPSNADIAERTGWNLGNRQGLGAQGLVFTNKGLLDLITVSRIAERVKDKGRGWKSVDGGIVFAMRKMGYAELVHYPSLIGHTGVQSSMGNGAQPHIPFDPTYDPNIGTQYEQPPKPVQATRMRLQQAARRVVPFRRRP